ncbi:unnamed protein product [Rhizopus stolonifer]
MSDLPAPATQQLVVIVNNCFVSDQRALDAITRLIKSGVTEHYPLIEEYSGCPSCIAHFKELKDFKEHIVNNHPQAIPLQSRQRDDNDQLTQENSDNERELPNSKRPSEDDAELLVSMYLSFLPPDDNDHLLIHAFNATDTFYKLQQSLQTQK